MNAESRDITFKWGNCARLLIRPSVMPSLKYSVCGSPLVFTNGSTATESIASPPPMRNR
jgi:hypothetical protein